MQLQRNFFVCLFFGVLSTSLACSSGGSDGDPFNNGGDSGTGGMAGAAGSNGGGGASGAGGVGAGGAAGTVTGTGGASGECFPALCPDGNQYGCGDCIDNDGDGVADDRDPECLGPCDNTEGPVLLTGTPGETGNQCGADCYFDRGNGSGSGECKWDRRCDPEMPKDGCEYDESLLGERNYCPSEQPSGCADSCGALTPNGCDCFGCCTFPELEGKYVFLGSFVGNEGTCTLDELDNPLLCRTCTPAGNCLNTCERCELCLGKTELPADCFPGTGGAGGMGGAAGMGGDGGARCAPGVQACGLPGDPACPAGGFCLTGCCILVQ